MSNNPQTPDHWSQAVKDAFWTAVNAPTYNESAAATLAFARLLDPAPEPRTFSDGGVNDIRQLYAVQDAITVAGGKLTPPVHRAIDALREVWDRELRRAQEEHPAATPAVPVPPTTHATDRAALVEVAAQAIRDSNGTPEALAWWKAHPQLIPAHVYAAAVLAVLPPPADRAAVLREAADELGRMDYDTDSNDYGYDTYRDAWNGGVMDGADLLRRLADEAQQQGGATPEEALDLADGPVRCPLCPYPVTLHTPNGARAHFTAVHPEQRLVGPGPWPLLVTDGDEAQQQPDTETPCCADPTCTCVQVNAAGLCECTKWESGPGRVADEGPRS